MSPLLADAFALAERVGGAPVYLYTFARGNVVWRYTSDGLALTVAATGISYVAAKIDHEKIERKDESGASEIKVTLGSRLAVVAALRDGSTLPMWLAIHKYHPAAGSTDYSSELLEGAAGRLGPFAAFPASARSSWAYVIGVRRFMRRGEQALQLRCGVARGRLHRVPQVIGGEHCGDVQLVAVGRFLGRATGLFRVACHQRSVTIK